VGVGVPTGHHVVEGEVKERRGDGEASILTGIGDIVVVSGEEGA
jgi:hypothetical protein